MQPIIYDVAVSIDGYICGQSGDVSKFAHDGRVVLDYLARMSTYTTAIMGRSTYGLLTPLALLSARIRIPG